MSKGYGDASMEYGRATVAMGAGGSGTYDVVFSETFIATPSILVVPDPADVSDGATYEVAGSPAASKTGFRLSVSGSNHVSKDIRVSYFAHEKGLT